MRTTAGLWLTVSAMLFFAGCTSDLSLAGVGGQTTNGNIVGTVQRENGIPAENTVVRLIPGDFNPVADYLSFAALCQTDTTNANGGFSFSNVKQGKYSIEAVRWADGKRTLVQVSSNAGGQTDTAPMCILRNPGIVKIAIPDSADRLYGYFYIPGTTISRLLNKATGYLSIDSVPAGVLPSINYSVLNKPSTQSVIRYSVAIPSGNTVLVSLPSWKYARQLLLNTTANGANVTGTVYGFPVLIRVSSANIDFAQANINGSDIRFAKADGTPLPFEIERWDAAAGQAEIWVKVDTIYGNNGTQGITMYWGNPDATDASSGNQVFDAVKGFQGVWHLGEPASAPAKDATVNHFDGTPSATTPTPVIGMIGLAQEFNGSSTYFIIKNSASGALDFPEKGPYSISAWAYTDKLDSSFQAIVAKGAFQYNLEIHKFNTWQCAEYAGMVGWQVAMAPAVARQWAYLTSVRNGDSLHLYVNGALADRTLDTVNSWVVPRNTSIDVTIGRTIWPANEDSPYSFMGDIDEVRMTNVALSPDWITLCYMNQRKDDKLVVFK